MERILILGVPIVYCGGGYTGIFAENMVKNNIYRGL